MRAFAIVSALIALVCLVGSIQTKPATAQQAPTRSGGLKICRATNSAGRVVNWGCRANQPCCFSASTDQGFCGPEGGSCPQ